VKGTREVAVGKKQLILAGIIGRYPVGGVTWCALHYIAGFQRLGYEVFYLEDTGECGFDPITNGISTDPSYATRYIRQHLEIVGLENAWSYIDHTGRYHGKTRREVSAVCHRADLMVNLSGGCWFARPEYDALTKIFIDTDPGFTQRNMVEDKSLCDFFSAYDAFFTFALNVDRPDCTLAATPFQWHPTIQPLALEFWPVTQPPNQTAYTTIMSWRIDSFPGMGKGKQGELLRMLDLPKKCRQRLKLAIAGHAPIELLSRHGWEIIDGIAASVDPFAYQSFIQASKAELGFAKAMYVETHSGWFSDRTQCYLATGRPALVRDTGFSLILPCGEGLLSFSNEQELLDGMEEIERDYAFHSRRARELAEAYFSAEQVLRNLLQTAGLS
jgi:hypothetical protein